MNSPLQGFGLGLRPQHYDALLSADRNVVDWLEIVSENYLVDGGRPLAMLDRIAERWPLAMHGVALNIGGSDPLDREYLRALSALAKRVRPALISDHLCWSRHDGVQLHDLLPLPRDEATLAHVAARVQQVQDALGRQLVLENVSSYLRFAGDTLGEAEFLCALVQASGCGLLLDINNVYVNAHNHGIDAAAYLDALPRHAVKQLHLAGHSEDALGSGLLIDTHDAAVCDGVWALYAHALRRFGEVPTMIERDDDIPPLHDLLQELDIARRIASDARQAIAA
ncbi:DUF692 domain-containing protein [Thermomonas carbonis]|uniref:UPF0276 protein H9L16_06425 n=1 Tax=Thermomonas carbonis TaxID=1463158 RepID=A0A7G9STL6_9GAMM|nr:DUF692 domain-containing protein [Thermomonas carbonis]QNN71191.1 DUF692 domain-containing protein [Thermomonas carbonis]GHC11339.1 UPF0276 protein [Thermomonas carbonis]